MDSSSREYASTPTTTSSNVTPDSYKLESSHPQIRGMEILKEPRLNKVRFDSLLVRLKKLVVLEGPLGFPYGGDGGKPRPFGKS